MASIFIPFPASEFTPVGFYPTPGNRSSRNPGDENDDFEVEEPEVDEEEEEEEEGYSSQYDDDDDDDYDDHYEEMDDEEEEEEFQVALEDTINPLLIQDINIMREWWGTESIEFKVFEALDEIEVSQQEEEEEEEEE